MGHTWRGKSTCHDFDLFILRRPTGDPLPTGYNDPFIFTVNWLLQDELSLLLDFYSFGVNSQKLLWEHPYGGSDFLI